VLTQSNHLGSGKVRELFTVGDDLLLVASDRISAYDVVLNQDIPDKGKVLTALSAFWFEVTADLTPNHLLSVRSAELPEVGIDDLAGRAMLCRRAEPILLEFVVRGYLAGSGWKEYRATGGVCGHRLPPGLLESAALPEPILTPATKAATGHDENITEDQARALVGPSTYNVGRERALAVYRRAAELAAGRGVVIADTKLEFGFCDGEVILIDEVLTPDSSRFWPADSYEPGAPQHSFDKQYVRDWLDGAGWDHAPPAPELPGEVVDATGTRYVEAYERLTGRPFSSWMLEVAG
jgi:phosphoribosylaminoimidazole-succinocarboxamide synthase